MLTRFIRLAMLLALGAAACATPASAQEGMPNFASDAELRAFLMPGGELGVALPPPPPPPPPPMPAPPPPAADMAGAPAQVSAPAPAAAPGVANPSITNNQVVGVEEGGIVKVAGDYLVVLRRGRLFTVSTAGGDLRPVHAIDAYAPGVDASGDWYDEMLVSGDLIVVIGYSHERGGTEINRFRLGRDGRMSFQDAYHLRSDDYFSNRNYASRLVDQELVVYSPLSFYGDEKDPLDALPGLSRWEPGRTEPAFRRIASAREVYIPRPLKKAGPESVEAMHAVSRCDLTSPVLACSSTVVLGPRGRTFFVSQNAVYVWVMPMWSTAEVEPPSFLYRIPFAGGRPTAVQVQGSPVDQFSFNANAAAGRLDILVVPEGGGDEMWSPEFAKGQPALLRLPTSRFGDGSGTVRASDYRYLPGGDRNSLTRNRFVGGHLLYALADVWGAKPLHRLVAVPVEDGPPTVFDLPWSVERIEQVGGDALAVGGTEAATFLTVELDGAAPRLGDRFEQPGSRQSDSRSHAFFFRPDSADGRDGLMGLPVQRLAGNAVSASMLFVRRSDRRLAEFGRLDASGVAGAAKDDGCTASCVDWYGNARPIFLKGRVFALMGYELVEGDASGERIRELRRVSFAPPPRK